MLLIKFQCFDEFIDIGEFMSYLLIFVFYSFGILDGFFNKINKVVMLYYLIDDIFEEVVVLVNSMYI